MHSLRTFLPRVIAFALASSAATHAVAQSAASPLRDPIAWRLAGEPRTSITMDQRASFRLWLVARNTGAHAVDTRRERLEFFEDGHRSMQLELAFGNGARETSWSSLPAGETVREARDMGTSILPTAGTHVFVLRRDGTEVARLEVHVTRNRPVAH